MCHAHNDLEGIAQATGAGDGNGRCKAEWSPNSLKMSRLGDRRNDEYAQVALTTVMASTQSMKGSDVKYRESDSAYSFHSWANKSCEPARVACL